MGTGFLLLIHRLDIIPQVVHSLLVMEIHRNWKAASNMFLRNTWNFIVLFSWRTIFFSAETTKRQQNHSFSEEHKGRGYSFWSPVRTETDQANDTAIYFSLMKMYCYYYYYYYYYILLSLLQPPVLSSYFFLFCCVFSY